MPKFRKVYIGSNNGLNSHFGYHKSIIFLKILEKKKKITKHKGFLNFI